MVGLEVKERQEPGYTSLAFTECGERTTGCFEYGGTVMGSILSLWAGPCPVVCSGVSVNLV